MTTALHLRAAVTDSAAPTFRESLIKKNVQFRLKICIVLLTYNTRQMQYTAYIYLLYFDIFLIKQF